MMERMERWDADAGRRETDMERQMERRETELRERVRLEAKVAQLEAAMDGSRVAPLTSVASDVCASRPHAAPPPSMLIDRADTALASVVDEFDILSPRGGDVAVASGSRGPPAAMSAAAVSRPSHGNGLGSAVDSGSKDHDDLAVSAAMGGLASAADSVSASAAFVVSSQPFTPAAASTVQPYDNVDVHSSGVELSLLDGSVLTPHSGLRAAAAPQRLDSALETVSGANDLVDIPVMQGLGDGRSMPPVPSISVELSDSSNASMQPQFDENSLNNRNTDLSSTLSVDYASSLAAAAPVSCTSVYTGQAHSSSVYLLSLIHI